MGNGGKWERRGEGREGRGVEKEIGACEDRKSTRLNSSHRP